MKKKWIRDVIHYGAKTKTWKIMRLSAFFLFLFLSQVWAGTGYSQQTKLTLKMDNVRVIDVLDEIENNSEFYFLFNQKLVDVERKVNVDAKEKTIDIILTEIFDETDVRHQVNDRLIILTTEKSDLSTESVIQQQKSVSGKVTDETGQPLPGVTVIIKGTTNGTVTNADGKYTISNTPEDATLQFSFVGMRTQEVEVGNQTTINVSMVVDAIGIEEVVAIGYGTARKKDLTGSVVKIDVTKLAELPNANAVQSLRGSVAGITVIDNGRPGSDGSITIRGNTSISAGNSPLIVLDGIPYTGGSLSDINSNDIESIDILKDASSAAIYGSRATNGVILITTKRGKEGGMRLNFNTYYGKSDYAHTPQMMGPEKYLQLKEDAAAYTGSLIQLEPLELENFNAGITIDPWEEIKQDAPMQSHELSVSGKNETVSYYLSGSYTDVKGVVFGDNFARLSFRNNFDIQVANWMKVGINSGYTSKDYSGIQADIYSASWLSPYADLYYDDGVPRPQPMNIGLVWNPLSDALLNDEQEILNIFFSNIYSEIKLPLKGLTYRINLGNTLVNQDKKYYAPQFIRETYYSLGSGSKYHAKNNSFTLENIIKYKTTVNDTHNLDVTLMYGYETKHFESSTLSSNNIFNDALSWNALEIGENFSINTAANESQAVSAMARIGYRFGEKYMLNATVRRDGYSAFGDGKKYGVFPSFGIGWNISEESFLQNAGWLDMLKIRASYGMNGNRAISSYASQSRMKQINYIFGDGGTTAVGLYSDSMANPDLSWETTAAFNYGIDYNIFSNRVRGAIEYYHMETSDLLLYRSIPEMTGNSGVLTNIGATENKGFEFSVASDNMKSGDFLWTSNFIFSLNRNKITALTGNDLDEDGIEDDDIASGWFIGESIHSNYDYVWDGIWQEGDDMSIDPGAQPGFVRFKDISGPEGVPDGIIGPEDRKVLHSQDPKFTAGLSNSFSYKGFSLSLLFNIRYGGYKPNSLLNIGTNYFDQANVMDLPYWTPENPLEDWPSVGYPNPYGYKFYESLSFIRLQDLSLSYIFPKEVLSKLKLGTLKVYVSGKNLHCWTKWHGWDPEHGTGGRGRQGSGYSTDDIGPLMRTWTVGLNVGL